ncbi:hypothetical protein [Shewanella sp. 10N.286.48.A6]|uniref:hypothetical protein n=1 Tax=Shewanella sp. 10N.286.48.A6 TaxID=1880833 RepID=UPI000C815903|nr:hypothetical protein [Shewanella sp. 10N.286.48.A6]PMH96258.1 hypothetical protein BCU55_02795 [Shewanella sp. 10N.286.48.A6]
MMKQTNLSDSAKKICDSLWIMYCVKYPLLEHRIPTILFHTSIYQTLANHKSVTGSSGRVLQEDLLCSFESWYPNIHQARNVDWIDLSFELVEYIQKLTGDYSYGFADNGDFIRGIKADNWQTSINEQLFLSLSVPDIKNTQVTNQSQEIKRQLTNALSRFIPKTSDNCMAVDNAIYTLLIEDVSALLLNQAQADQTISKDERLAAYLYCFQDAVLAGIHSKEACTRLAFSLINIVHDIYLRGMPPQPMNVVFQLGFNHPKAVISQFNKLALLLDGQTYTINTEHIEDELIVNIWRYPNMEATMQKIVINKNGEYCINLRSAHELVELDADDVINHLADDTDPIADSV